MLSISLGCTDFALIINPYILRYAYYSLYKTDCSFRIVLIRKVISHTLASSKPRMSGNHKKLLQHHRKTEVFQHLVYSLTIRKKFKSSCAPWAPSIAWCPQVAAAAMSLHQTGCRTSAPLQAWWPQRKAGQGSTKLVPIHDNIKYN